MKTIIYDSLHAHISMFAITLSFLLACLMGGVVTPLWFVILGVNCFFLVMLAAMRIADFEMSKTN